MVEAGAETPEPPRIDPALLKRMEDVERRITTTVDVTVSGCAGGRAGVGLTSGPAPQAAITARLITVLANMSESYRSTGNFALARTCREGG